MSNLFESTSVTDGCGNCPACIMADVEKALLGALDKLDAQLLTCEDVKEEDFLLCHRAHIRGMLTVLTSNSYGEGIAQTIRRGQKLLKMNLYIECPVREIDRTNRG